MVMRMKLWDNGDPLSSRCKVEVGTGCLPEEEGRTEPKPGCGQIKLQQIPDSGEESPSEDIESSDSNTEHTFRPTPRPRRSMPFRYGSDSDIEDVHRLSSRLVSFEYIDDSNTEDMFRLRLRLRMRIFTYISDSIIQNNDSNTENMSRPGLRLRRFNNDSDIVEDVRSRSEIET
ncbi:hypothetical protein V6N13_132907 [Hibiscus sabdariffa]